jgi:hypothetical protein
MALPAWEAMVRSIEKLAAFSLLELVRGGAERLLPKDEKMGFSKVIPVGSAGAITISEEGGVATLKVSLSQSVGGGALKDVAKGSASVEVDMSAKQVIDAGLELAAHKFPAAALVIESAKTIIDAEMAKL